ncbi:iron complex outermembrane recepter protein [Nitrosospira briensis]|uniref:Iron complex outermembrane recepter protein n=1 Tax=Nitrosospira briensis TaxID=35799 RepID=A0A1I5ERA9_9PROT|nr:TonB-dependent siderophore receptor [Nitrosospira briensis]SFO14017.1 iron complex outermembrane recepter protein [Nitrosospira briensis]
MLCNNASAARSSCTPAPLRLKLLSFAIRMAFAGLVSGGFVNHVHAQTAPQAKEAAAGGVATLPEMKVSAERPDELPQPYAGGQVARGGRLGILGNTDIMKAPLSISSYTSQMIRDQQAITAADLLSKDPSVRSTGQRGGVVDSFYIRGFPIGEGNVGELAFDGQYGVAPNYRIFTEYAERVEVIKGPAALLYGMSPNSGVGGVINIVPKRASPTDLTRLTGTYMSNTQGGGHLDVSRRFGADRQFGIRLNGSHHQGNTPLDNQFRQADVGAVALDYQGERFRATLDALGQYERFKAPQRPFLVAADIDVPSAPNGRRNVTQPWGRSTIEDVSLLFKTEYDISDSLTLFGSVGGSHSWVDRLSDQTPMILNAAGDTTSTPMRFRFGVNRSSADGGVRARFNTGPIRHTVTLQGSGYRDRLERGSSTGTAVLSNMYSPVDRPGQDLARPDLMKISETEFYGGALTDVLSIADERVLLTLGVRLQQIHSENFGPTGAVTSSYSRLAATPLAGLVVRPWQNVSIYANRMEGLSKGDIAPQIAANAGQIFAPYKTEQVEVGVKIDYGRLITTLSLFEIKRPSGQLTGNVFAVDSEQRNRGLELALFGEPMSGVRLLGGMTLFDAELTKTSSAATVGNKPVGVPSLQANLGAEWDVQWLPGFTLTGNLIHTGKRYINQANTQSVPSWTTFDFGARYSAKVLGKSTTVRGSVLNAFDTNHWSGVASFSTLSLGTPRTVLVSATVDF